MGSLLLLGDRTKQVKKQNPVGCRWAVEGALVLLAPWPFCAIPVCHQVLPESALGRDLSLTGLRSVPHTQPHHTCSSGTDHSNCQLDTGWSYGGGVPLSMPMRELPGKLNPGRSTNLQDAMLWSRKKRESPTSASMPLTLLPAPLRQKEESSTMVSLPR